ncbi:MAG: ribosome recycling factor [Candidatus Komeilibacteria bacterium]
MQYSDEAKKEFQATLDHFKSDISALRTGRVSPSVVDDIMVEAYGSSMPLVQLATISAPEPRLIMIQPWDKAVTKNIEQAIQKSELNLQPIVDRDTIRLNFPALTEEKRKELVKLLGQKAEAARVSMRQRREKIREHVIADHKDNTISEDQKFKALEDLDKIIKDWHEQIRLLAEAKEKEVMTI